MLDMARESADWFAEVLTVDDTQAISAQAVERSRREYRGIFGDEAGDALIEQEY
jgi:phage terminase large subunit